MMEEILNKLKNGESARRTRPYLAGQIIEEFRPNKEKIDRFNRYFIPVNGGKEEIKNYGITLVEVERIITNNYV